MHLPGLGTSEFAADLGATEFRVADANGQLHLLSMPFEPPVRGGVLLDHGRAVAGMSEVLRAARGSLRRARILLPVPIDLDAMAAQALEDVIVAAGASEVKTVPDVLAAAIGAELPVREPVGSMLVLIGAGRTEVAVLSMGGIVVSADAPTDGAALDRAAAKWMLGKHGLTVKPSVARHVKERLGGALAPRKVRSMDVRGRDPSGRVPREATVDSTEMQVALSECCAVIRDAVLAVLADTPPELAGDIHDRGIVLAGGGAGLYGLDRYLRDATRLPVLAIDKPAHAVIRGAAALLSDDELREQIESVAP